MKFGADRPVRRLFGYGLADSEIPDLREAGGYQVRHASYVLNTHRHDPSRLEICYILRGQQTQAVNGKEFVLTPGDVLLVYPNEEHGAIQYRQEPAVVYYLIFHVRPDADEFLNLRGPQARLLLKAILNLPNRHVRLSAVGRALMEQVPVVQEEWAKTAGETRRLATLRIQSRVTALLAEIAASGAGPGHASRSAWSRRIVDYIESHLDDSLTTARLARHLGISSPHFKERFRKEIGLPPADYVHRRKIEAAKRLLAAPGATATRVAFDLGFSSSGYFATVFKRYTGRTPTAYRREAPPAAPADTTGRRMS